MIGGLFLEVAMSLAASRFIPVLALPALVLTAGLAAAQTPGAASVDGRFVLRETPDGLLRMDTRTGTMSLCTRQAGTFTCRLVADDRAALDQEIERLKAENEALKRGGATALARPNGDQGMTLPSDAEVDRALSLAERIWRRLRGMIRESEQEQQGDRRL